jgi:hypothetical protein
MQNTLKNNRCFVQIEAFESREQVIEMMANTGYRLVKSLLPNFIFEN